MRNVGGKEGNTTFAGMNTKTTKPEKGKRSSKYTLWRLQSSVPKSDLKMFVNCHSYSSLCLNFFWMISFEPLFKIALNIL